jgi:hypothetical protein
MSAGIWFSSTVARSCGIHAEWSHPSMSSKSKQEAHRVSRIEEAAYSLRHDIPSPPPSLRKPFEWKIACGMAN